MLRHCGHRREIVGLVFVSFLVIQQSATAVDRYWVGGSNFWELSGNWSATAGGPGGAGQPGVGDNGYISSNTTINVTRDSITPGYALPGPALVRMSGSGAAIVFVTQTANANNMAASRLEAGYEGRGHYVQAGALNTVGDLFVGISTGGVGTYSISGGGTLNVSSQFVVGSFAGVGTFNQDGGQVTTPGSVSLGFNSPASHGYYSLTDGTLQASSALTVAQGGDSTFVQSGGSARFSFVVVGDSAAGNLDLSGGSLTSTFGTAVGLGGTGSLNIGGTGYYRSQGNMAVNATGQFQQSGGTLQASGSININGGRYTYTGGTLLMDPGTTIGISGGGTASFNSGFINFPNNTGVAITDGRLEIGGFTAFGSNAVGSLLASGSNSRVVAAAGTTYFGNGTGGIATFTFTAGAAGTFDAMSFGNGFGVGTLNVSGGAGLTANRLFAGNGTAQINISGANSGIAMTGASELRLGDGFAGSLNIGTGSYFVAPGGTQLIGRGGRVTITGGSWFSQGEVILDGGAVTVVNGSFFGNSVTLKNGAVGSFAVGGGYFPFMTTRVLSDSLYDLGADEIAIFAGRVFILDGGRLKTAAINIFGSGEFQFHSGTCELSGPGGLAIGTGMPLGNELHLTPGKALFVSNNTTLLSGSLVALEGGIFSTGSLSGGGSFMLGTGTLRLTSADLTVGAGSPLGTSVQVSPGARVEILGSGKAVVQAGATLYLGGGSISADGGVTNSGEIHLGGIGSRISGGPFNNSGLLRGNGRIDNMLVNSATGTVRAAAADSLLFTGPGNSNSGTVQLLGGVVEFQQSLTNNAAGRINGRGSMIANGGLTNNGSITLSGGAAELSGDLTNTPTSRVLITGGSQTTFYNDVTNDSGSQFKVSDASVAAFLGTVTGLAAFTGSGTTIFEGPASFGALAAGVCVVGSNGALSADSVRQAALIVRESGNAEIVANGTSTGTSKLQLLEIDGAPGAWTGRLNLNNNNLVIDYTAATPIATVRDQIKTARGTGNWNGTGMTSTLADASTFSLGYAENTELNLATFGGQSVDATSILVTYTRYGDANLDRVVNIGDFALLAANFNTASTWSKGDFNYDGTTNIGDFSLLAANFNRSLPAEPPRASVPEPTAAACVLAVVAAVRHRTRAGARAPELRR